MLSRYLSKRLEGTSFTYYAEPLAPSSGMQSGLPILLADYTFRRAEDVETYLSLLDQTDTYFEGLVSYEKQKAAHGLFMPAYSSTKVIEQCDSIMNKEALENGTHFLHITFEERLNELVTNGSISTDQADKWLAENDRLLTTVMQPAYEKTADAFTILEDKGTNLQGLFYFPDGKAYYEHLLSSATGSSRSVSEMKKLLFEDYQKNYNALLSLIRQYPALATNKSFADLPLASDTPAGMLEDLQTRMSSDFPAFPAINQTFHPACTVKTVSSSMEDYCSPAYYLTPPMDDLENNIIYINQKHATDPLSLYTTLAHEGYPGHLYQTVYSQLYQNLRHENPIRSLLHYGGYVEGWAVYVENLSYEYAQNIMKDSQPDVAAYYECCRISRNLHLCLYSLLDIAIHHEEATFSQVHKILQSIGVNDVNTSKGIYQYIVAEPTNYPKYYFGFLEFQILKKKAEALWASDFSNYRFHKFVLETGPSDFQGLHDRLVAS